MTDNNNNNNNNESGSPLNKTGRPIPGTKRNTFKPVSQKSKKKERQRERASRRDRKIERLQLHGLLESLGQAINTGKEAAGHIDTAVKIANAFEQVKKALRYNGSHEDELVENAIARLEDIVALIVALLNTKNYAGFIATLHMYIRTHYTRSTSKFVIKLITDMFESASSKLGTKTEQTEDPLRKLHLHSDEDDIPDLVTGYDSDDDEDDDDDFHVEKDQIKSDLTDEDQTIEDNLTPEEKVEIFKSCISNWKQFRHGAFSRHACQLVNILTTFGWLDLAENPIKIGDFELFRARAWEVQKNSLDFLDVILETFAFFLERGYLAFAKGDPSLLLYDDKEAARFEQEYSLLVACDSLMETGRLEDLKTESVKGESDFESRLELLITKCYSMIQTEKNPHAKSVLTNRLVVLKKLRSKLIMLQKQSPVRTKPYGVAIFGGSAVGKTIINSIITKVILTSNGFESSKRHVVTLNDSDPYQSEFRSYHTAVTMDDFGNTKADKYEGSPTAKIIDFLNNVPKAALSPIAELKGNVMIRPKLVSVTTNVKTLLAHIFSNEPVSILRRFNVHLDVRLREEWVDPETGGINTEMLKGVFIPDAWVIQLQRVEILRTPGAEPDDYRFVTILKDASLRECLDWMMDDTKKYYAQQDNFVESTEKFYDMKLCEHMDDPQQCPKCKPLESHAHEEFIFDDSSVEELSVTDPLEYIPVESAVKQWYRNTGMDYAVHRVKTECKNLVDAFETHKSTCLKAVFAASAGLAIVYGSLQFFKAAKRATDMLSGHNRDDGVPEKMDTDYESNWKKVEYHPIPATRQAQTTTPDQFDSLLKRNLAYCTVFNYAKNKSRSCNIFPIRGNTWLLPSHMIDSDAEVTIEVYQGRDGFVNRSFREIVDESKIFRFSDDFMLIRLVNGGPVRDMTPYIAETDYQFQREHVKFMVKDREGVVQTLTTKLQERKTFPTKNGPIDAVSYNLPIPTANGMCIAPVYTYRSPHVIVGFHIAGMTGKSFGVAAVINREMINDAMERFQAQNRLQCHSEGHMVTSKYGKEYSISPTVPKDHAVNRLTEDDDGQEPSAIIYGEHDLGRTRFKSDVRKSPISDAVREIMGIQRMHGPPNSSNIGKHWERDLNLMSHPKGTFRPVHWNAARADFLRKVEKFLEAHPQAVNVTYPLAHDYVMAGADGIAAYSRLPLNTSMGWPLNKKKNLYISTVDREVPGVTDPIDFEDPMFHEEIARIEEVLASGERIHTIFRGNLKDEPTKWTKDKIRVFAGCEVAFTCVTRKYYLPIVRLIQNHWKDFECAVGINAHGKQWNELVEYVIKYGKDRIIAGDYKAFDKTASPEAMMSAFDVLIRIAEICGYTERELMVMRGVATEISYPIYELDGIIVQLFGSNPSGHPLTVIVNNLMNSLYMRYVYYTLHEGESDVPDFDTVISLLCYGDDNIMSVHEKEKLFKMYKIVEVLASVGITYTKADKTVVGEGDDYETMHDVEFLKRAFVWNPAFGAYTAALDLNSIGKSLHNQMASKTTPREVIAAQAIQSANAEFAFHGPEVFNEMQPKLYEVARVTGLTELVGELPTLLQLIERYHDSTPPKNMVLEPVLDSHSSEEDFVMVDEPTGDEVEQYIRQSALYRRLKEFGRLETKRGKQVMRQLRIFKEKYGVLPLERFIEERVEEMKNPKPAFLSEDHQLNYLRTTMEHYGFRTIGINIPFMGDRTLGEIDGLFEVAEGDHRILVLVEAKMIGQRTKGLAQLGKYGLALAVAGPENLHVRTVLMTGRDLEPIGEFGTSNYEWPAELEL